MAPLPDSILSTLTTILRRSPTPSPAASDPLIARVQNVLPRSTTNLVDPGAGVTPPESMNNIAIFTIFGLIGAAFVVTGIWFFFWAKNGGFYFKENDWEDYKSTVLRRKGPNGTTLSGATESTDLGGGSVVHGEKNGRSIWGGRKKGGKKGMKRYKDFEDGDTMSQVTGSAGGSTLASEMSEINALKWKAAKAHKEKKAKKEKKEKKKKDPRSEATTEARSVVGEEEEMDAGVADALRTYRHEKPARVGGLNKQPDGSSWDGSNDNSTVVSDLLSHREHTPTNTPTKVRKERNDSYTGGSGGIRKVESVSTGTKSNFWNRSSSNKKKEEDEEEEERIRAEAKKLQDKGRAAQRRDFSFSRGDDGTSITGSTTTMDEERRARREALEARRANRSPTKKVPGSYYQESVTGSALGSELGSEMSGDLGTKSYHHPIPGLSSTAGSEYADEKRKKRGYRRDA